MKKSFAVLIFALVAVLPWTGIAHADSIFSNGATLRGGSGTAWSSDLGLDYHYPLHLDDPGDGASDIIGQGNTNPFTPWNHYFDGESVDNISYYASPAYLSSALHMDISPGGNVEGKVNHVHIDNISPPVGGYGLGAYSAVNGLLLFDPNYAGVQPMSTMPSIGGSPVILICPGIVMQY
jgi:hypothetical protein